MILVAKKLCFNEILRERSFKMPFVRHQVVETGQEVSARTIGTKGAASIFWKNHVT
jgi:hypothetical protein